MKEHNNRAVQEASTESKSRTAVEIDLPSDTIPVTPTHPVPADSPPEP